VSTDTDRERANRRRAATGLTVTLVGLVILAVAGVLAWSWRAELPDPVATHWGRGGTPNGFAPLSRAIAVPLGAGVVLVLAFGALTWAIGHSSVNRRLGAAITAWVSVFMSIVLLGSLWGQRGLSDAHNAHDVNGVLLVTFAGAAVAAVVAAVAVPGDPRQPTTHAVDASAPRATLIAGQRTTWAGHASSHAVLAISVPLTVLLLALAVYIRVWTILLVDVLVLGLLLSMASFVVRVDQAGVAIRSTLGLPRYRIPLDEVIRADVIQVSAIRDFGGWGWRVGRGGRVGIVLRSGEGLLVERTGGRSIVVTIDDATTAAGVVNSLADRARAR
jgi:hypothetical protein